MSESIPNTICDAMERDGYTDLQVRALIAAHRGLLTENQELADALAHAESHCTVHGDVAHGGEAEELRKGIERLIEQDYDACGGLGDEQLVGRLQRLLDDVDARDSLAWGERHDEKRDAEVIALREELSKMRQVQHG